MKPWKIVTLIVLAVLAIIVVLQNTAAVETHILFFTLIMPRALLLFLTLLIGVILGLLISLYRDRRSKNRKTQSG